MHNSIAFGLGAVFGGFLAYVVTKDRVTKAEKAKHDKEMASMKEYVDKLRKSEEVAGMVQNLKYTATKEDEAQWQEKPNPVNRPSSTQDKGKEKKKEVTDYVKYSSSKWYGGGPEYEHPMDDEEDVYSKRVNTGDKTGIEVLSNVEEAGDLLYGTYDEVPLYYILDDNVLIDEDGEEVDDVYAAIGNSISDWKRRGMPGRQIVVANHNRATLYDITVYDENPMHNG